MSLIAYHKTLFTTMTITQALASLIDEIEYMQFVEKSYDSPKIASRKKDDVKSFLLSTDRFVDRFAEEATLGNYLERLLLLDNQDKQNSEEDIMKNEVQLMTLHSSKGLEFDIVNFIILDIDVKRHHISANRIADLTHPVCIFNFPDISGVGKMIHHFVSVHPLPPQ